MRSRRQWSPSETSAASGESAGTYEPGSDQPGTFCHRSLNALIRMTAVPGIDAKLNLACSGARSANLYVGGPGQSGEPAHVKLAQAATAYDKLIFIEVGANDDPHARRWRPTASRGSSSAWHAAALARRRPGRAGSPR